MHTNLNNGIHYFVIVILLVSFVCTQWYFQMQYFHEELNQPTVILIVSTINYFTLQ